MENRVEIQCSVLYPGQAKRHEISFTLSCPTTTTAAESDEDETILRLITEQVRTIMNQPFCCRLFEYNGGECEIKQLQLEASYTPEKPIEIFIEMKPRERKPSQFSFFKTIYYMIPGEVPPTDTGLPPLTLYDINSNHYQKVRLVVESELFRAYLFKFTGLFQESEQQQRYRVELKEFSENYEKLIFALKDK